jgi:hypothetical protein
MLARQPGLYSHKRLVEAAESRGHRACCRMALSPDDFRLIG